MHTIRTTITATTTRTKVNGKDIFMTTTTTTAGHQIPLRWAVGRCCTSWVLECSGQPFWVALRKPNPPKPHHQPDRLDQ
jgi:hypothetical protein